MATIKRTVGSYELWVKCVATVMETCCGSIGTVKMAPETKLKVCEGPLIHCLGDPDVVN